MCVSVSTLTAEPFDIQTQYLVEALTLIISRMSSKVKVKGQGRQVEKRDFQSLRLIFVRSVITKGCHVTPHSDVM